MYLPEPKHTKNYYTDGISEISYPALKADLECDVFIVGGGITGVSAAYHLAKRGFNVVIVEGNKVAWAASGRNGGMYTSHTDLDCAGLEKAVGVEHAKKYWELAVASQKLLLETLANEQIDCDLKQGSLTAALSEKDFESISHNYRLFKTKFDLPDSELVDAGDVSCLLGTEKYFGGVLHHAMPHLNPAKLVKGLADECAKQGVRIFEYTSVEAFQDSGADVQIQCAGGAKITAKSLLLACNANLGDLSKKTSSRFISLYSSIIATAEIDKDVLDSIFKKDIAVLESDMEIYYRRTFDNRIVFGGGGILAGRDGHVVKPLLRKMLYSLYPSIKNVPIDYVWGGWFGMTAFGDTPDTGRISKNVFYAQAIPMSWAFIHGHLFSKMLASDSQGYDVLSSIPIPRGPGGQLVSKVIHEVGNLCGKIRCYSGIY